jgi:hypothetical protein
MTTPIVLMGFIVGVIGSSTNLINNIRLSSFQPPSVPGQSYQICNEQAQYLTSPWTWDSLASGSQSYTVSQYQALAGYGTTLPSLPTYIVNEGPSATAATIYAPGQAVALSSYQHPNNAELFFFEGGSYTSIYAQTLSGDEFIGGSVPGYPEPVFNGASAINNSEDHWNATQGYGTVATTVTNSSTITADTGFSPGYYNNKIVFADGTVAAISSISGTTITLASPVTESAGTNFWVYGDWMQTGSASASAAQGATTFSVTPNSGGLLYLPGASLSVGATFPDGTPTTETVQIASVSGSTITTTQPLAQPIPTNAPVTIVASSGEVSLEYLSFQGGGGNNTIVAGSDWTIEHNYFHDNYAGGVNYQTTSAAGQAIMNANDSTVEYNCFQRLGEYAFNGGGISSSFDYNQVDQTPYQPDLSGNGQSGCGKWWGSFNNDVKDNSFSNERYSVCLWFDNGNAGQLVEGNYFYNIDGTAVSNETGWNSEYLDNLFEDVGMAISENDSGGWNIPNSRFNDQILIQGNTFFNAQQAVNIWGASGRSCLNSGEAIGNGESAPYCSGGFPNMQGDIQYFSHVHDSTTGGYGTVVENESCTSASPCSTVTLSGAISPEDWIGFDGAGPNTCSSATPCGTDVISPVATSTANTTDVSTFTAGSPGTVTVNSTTGFPSSGQLAVNTSQGSVYESTGAVLSYTGTTATTFTGVVLVQGTGTLSGGILAVQPYHATAVSCPGGNCTNNTVVTVSPAITSNVTAGTTVYGTGTCQYYDTANATASSPLAPNSIAYIDGCMWEDRNISVQSNTFYVNPGLFDTVPLPENDGSNWSCTVGSSGNCGENAMGYQYPGSNAEPYNNISFANAMMSNSSFSAPYNNLNASGSPLVGGSTGISANPETPYNDQWSNNTYLGPWTFQAYTQAAACQLNWASNALEWVGGTSGNACSGLTPTQWETYWGQDTGSTYQPIVVSLSGLSTGQEIYGPNVNLEAYEYSAAGAINSTFLLNGVSIGNLSAAPYAFNLNTLSYLDGTYTIKITGTDSNNNTDFDTTQVYISNGDFNGDGHVNLSDLAILAAHWGQADSNYSDGNITGQSTINLSDLAVLAANWGWVE